MIYSEDDKSVRHRTLLRASYVLPIAARVSQQRELDGYLYRMSRIVDEVIVVDGSCGSVFADHARAWSDHVRHVRPAFSTVNGKVAGVMTGVLIARHEAVIIADDDIRYRKSELGAMIGLLASHDVVRPQNVFVPMPWHARWDTARSLFNRLVDGDWPGTLGVRRTTLLNAGGYRGDVLFENLEMVRTIKAAGGIESVALEMLVQRRPPRARHFLSQRVRQAYDEWARPRRFALNLALLPVALLAWQLGVIAVGAVFGSAVVAAELGRRRGGGARVFPPSSALWAPLWLAERAFTSWVALAVGLILGGVRYRTRRIKRAATPMRELRERVAAVPSPFSLPVGLSHGSN